MRERFLGQDDDGPASKGQDGGEEHLWGRTLFGRLLGQDAEGKLLFLYLHIFVSMFWKCMSLKKLSRSFILTICVTYVQSSYFKLLILEWVQLPLLGNMFVVL